MDYYINVLKKYMVFEGRASRKEFWMFSLFDFGIMVVLSIFLLITKMPVTWFLSVLLIYALAIFFPRLSLMIRRFHDIGRSGWWFMFLPAFLILSRLMKYAGHYSILISILLLVLSVVLIVFWVTKGESGTNKYGPNPYEVVQQENIPSFPKKITPMYVVAFLLVLFIVVNIVFTMRSVTNSISLFKPGESLTQDQKTKIINSMVDRLKNSKTSLSFGDVSLVDVQAEPSGILFKYYQNETISEVGLDAKNPTADLKNNIISGFCKSLLASLVVEKGINMDFLYTFKDSQTLSFSISKGDCSK